MEDKPCTHGVITRHSPFPAFVKPLQENANAARKADMPDTTL